MSDAARLARPRRPRARTTARAAELTASVDAALRHEADPERARSMRAYLRDQFPFFGVPMPRGRAVLRQAAAAVGPPTEADLLTGARDLWEGEQRELQYAAVAWLRANAARLSTEAVPAVAWCITTKAWWDTVDDLAQNVIGPIVLGDRDRLRPVLDRWATGDDLWLARTAILHQNRYRADTDQAQLFRYCTLRAGDTEFFIRKAIGWALREHCRVDAVAVARFVEDHGEDLSGLSIREARKGLARHGGTG